MLSTIVLCGDSRVEGAGDKQDFPGPPGPQTSYGTTYTNLTNLVVTVVPAAGAPGTGFTCGGRINPSTGFLSVFCKTRGSGYVAGKMPTLTITGGDGTPPDVVVPSTPSGGYAVRLETYLRAHGFPQINVINMGVDGQKISGWNGAGAQTLNLLNSNAEGSAGDPATSLIYMDIGINDDADNRTAQQYHDDLLATVNFWLADGYTVMLSAPFGFGPAGTAAQTGAGNTLAQSYGAQIDNIVATNPAKILKGVDNYSQFLGNASYYGAGDTLHPSPAGDDAIAALLGPRIASVFTSAPTDPYRSDNATPVTILADYKPGAPNPFAGVGLGTFLLPTVVLTWVNPANLLGGTIHIMRMNAGTSDPFVVVGTVVGADANTAPAQTYTDTTVLNGHRYTYTAFATPYGDTTTP